MNSGQIMIDDERKKQKLEVIADLNALFSWIEYIEIELERIAPSCALSASTLRSAIATELIEKKVDFEMRHLRN